MKVLDRDHRRDLGGDALVVLPVQRVALGADVEGAAGQLVGLFRGQLVVNLGVLLEQGHALVDEGTELLVVLLLDGPELLRS